MMKVKLFMFSARTIDGQVTALNTGWSTTLNSNGDTVLYRQAQLVTAHGKYILSFLGFLWFFFCFYTHFSFSCGGVGGGGRGGEWGLF